VYCACLPKMLSDPIRLVSGELRVEDVGLQKCLGRCQNEIHVSPIALDQDEKWF